MRPSHEAQDEMAAWAEHEPWHLPHFEQAIGGGRYHNGYRVPHQAAVSQPRAEPRQDHPARNSRIADLAAAIAFCAVHLAAVVVVALDLFVWRPN